MNIYISVDLEGINGVSKFSQVNFRNNNDYEQVMVQLYKELNTIIESCFDAGAEKVTVNDAHSEMINLNINKLDDRVELITGKPKEISMMTGLDNTYTAAILLGYHPKASSSGGSLAHTFSEDFVSVKINNMDVGEAFINSAYAASLGVPIALVTGDDILKEEIYNQIGNIPFVVSKYSLANSAVKARPNKEYLAELKEKTLASLNNPTNWIINKQEGTYELKVEFSKVLMADLVELIPGVCRVSPRTVKYSHPKFDTLYKTLQVICIVAGSSKNYY